MHKPLVTGQIFKGLLVLPGIQCIIRVRYPFSKKCLEYYALNKFESAPPPPKVTLTQPVPRGFLNLRPTTKVLRGTGRMGPARCRYAKGLTSD